LEIELTAQAEADLVEIGDFIAKDNPLAAERYVRRLRDRIEVLREFPGAGHPIRKDPTSAHLSNVRLLSCTRLKPTGSKFCVSGMEREAGRESRRFPDLSGAVGQDKPGRSERENQDGIRSRRRRTGGQIVLGAGYRSTVEALSPRKP
jgi:plasmid stabilization system protein ParE